MSKDVKISKYVKSVIDSTYMLGLTDASTYSKKNKAIVFYTLLLKATSDIYNRKNLPENAKWDTFESQISQFKKGDKIQKFDGIETLYNNMFSYYYNEGLLNFDRDRVDFGFSLGFENVIFTFQLVVKTIGKYQFKSAANYAEVFEEFISQYAFIETKLNAENTTPSVINKLLVALLGDFDSLMDYTSGYGGLLYNARLKRKNAKLFGVEINQTISEIQKLRFAFDKNTESICDNSIELNHINPIRTDVVAMVPPFKLIVDKKAILSQEFPYGEPPRNSFDLGWIQLALSNLKEEGKAFIVLNKGSLFRGGKELAIRKSLIEQNLIEAIISLPGNVFYSTAIPTCIWVLNKKKTSNSVCFIETEGLESNEMRFNTFSDKEISSIVNTYSRWSLTSQISDNDRLLSISNEEILKNQCSLNSFLYKNELEKEKIENARHLNTLGDVVKLSTLRSSEKQLSLSIKDLGDSEDNFRIDINKLSMKGELKRNVLFSGRAILFSVLGEKLKPSFLDTRGLEVAISKNIFVFKINEAEINIEYFIQELYKPYVQNQFESFRTGTAIRNISIKNLLNVVISVPSLLSQQIEIVEKEKAIRFEKTMIKSGFEKQLAKLKESQSADLGSKKHNINQHLNNVKASADTLKMVLDAKKNDISINDVINPNTGMTIGKRFGLMLESIEKVIHFVDNLTNDEDFDILEKTKVVTLLNQCIDLVGVKNKFQIVKDYDEDVINTYVQVSKKDFEELFNNIIENAEKHGFTEATSGNIIKIIVELNGGSLIVRFENNGKPFPKGMTLEKFKTKGEKAGATGNDGIGSWKIAEIANHFKAELDIIDEPENIFPVGIQLTFKNEINEI